jgi:hypothetical protein
MPPSSSRAARGGEKRWGQLSFSLGVRDTRVRRDDLRRLREHGRRIGPNNMEFNSGSRVHAKIVPLLNAMESRAARRAYRDTCTPMATGPVLAMR